MKGHSKPMTKSSSMGSGQKFVQATGQDKQAMKGSVSDYAGDKIGGSSGNLSHSIKGGSSA